MLEKGVVVPGAGRVGKNTVRNTMILLQAFVFQMQKTITLPDAVEKRKDLRKRSIVVEAIQDIVGDGGKLYMLQ